MPSHQPTAGIPLTAAEALILLEPNKVQGQTALKLTLLELLAHRLLTVHRQEQWGFLGMCRKVDLLQCAPDAAQRGPARSHVQAVLRTLSAARASRRVPMKQVIAAMRKAFGADLAGYQRRYIVPELVVRGLLEAYRTKSLWVFWRTHYRHTPVGETARRQLGEQLTNARALPALLDIDPAQAAAIAVTLGSTLLLAEELRSHYAQLSRALREFPGDSFSTTGSDTSFDCDTLSAVESGWEAFDTGFDTADGGDGGEGSDGGDGGDGGGE
jgi:hypothetical protein